MSYDFAWFAYAVKHTDRQTRNSLPVQLGTVIQTSPMEINYALCDFCGDVQKHLLTYYVARVDC